VTFLAGFFGLPATRVRELAIAFRVAFFAAPEGRFPGFPAVWMLFLAGLALGLRVALPAFSEA
jgi:hypothetical protein